MFRDTEANVASQASANPNADSAGLLRKFAIERSQAAFAEFVQRHIDLVHSAAVRRCGGDAHRAEDIVQLVFTAAAREAKSLSRHPAICAWLHTATRNVAINAALAEQRRLERERSAVMTLQDLPGTPMADWTEIRAVLDRAIDELAEPDRAVILLRYFENNSYAEIGAALNLSENSARMRTDRALEKLRRRLAARGIRSTAAALGPTLAGRAVAAAPTYLAGVIAGVVMREIIGTNVLTLPTQPAARLWRAAATVGATAIVATAVFLATHARDSQTNPTTRRLSPAAAVDATAPMAAEPPSDGRAATTSSNPTAAAVPRATIRSTVVFSGPVTAESILQHMAEAYASLQWYQDSGDVTVVAPNARDADVAQFRTTYTRPDLLRVDCFDRSRRRPADAPRPSTAILSNGNQSIYYPGHGMSSRLVSIDTALALSVPASKGAAYHIPRLLLPVRYAGFYFTLDRLIEPKLLADETVENEPCYVVEGRHPNGTLYTLWIAKSDLLVRKVRTVGRLSALSTPQATAFQASAAQTLEEVHRDIQTNAEISRTTFDLPALAQ